MVDDDRAYAHTVEGRPQEAWQPLERHLLAVERLAAGFASRFGGQEWAGLAGRLHDLGKYRPAFQAYLREVMQAPGRALPRVEHSTAGAIHAVDRLGPYGTILAYLISGHHGGLPDWNASEADHVGLASRLERKEQHTEAAEHAPDDIVSVTVPSGRPPSSDVAFWIRMLFSCMVDADYLDTEAFCNPAKTSARGLPVSVDDLLAFFDGHMARLTRSAPDTPVNRLRTEVLARCRASAGGMPGIYSLTVPTGGGKTLSSLAFALEHARTHGLERIIYVIPYTSIIEQTADTFRGMFGDAVVEHHSNIEPDNQDEYDPARLASENWDAPLIVTTSVQFFESLFSARSGRARKLHNIVNSVVVLDEAQLLPVEFLQPILASIQQMASHYGVTFLLCTATQPALSEHSEPGFHFKGLQGCREIVSDPAGLAEELCRVDIQVSGTLAQHQEWEEIARRCSSHESVLCIVNRRDDCRNLARIMPEGTIHLSGLMCGEHRSEVVRQIKARLQNHQPTRVVSTQLVEAGVDLDFPVVYRALAGLDSIAQAAGRCNREGRLPGRGQVFIFRPPTDPPPGVLRQGAGIAERQLEEPDTRMLRPETFQRYFRELFWMQSDRLDREGIGGLLKPNPQHHYPFALVADRFRIIDDRGYRPVIVKYGAGSGLIRLLESQSPDRWLLRKLQRFVVNIPRYLCDRMLRQGDIAEVHGGILVQVSDLLYHRSFGLLDPEKGPPDADVCVV